ncbi:hypothetical protein J6590_017183 [Homalodisca vitripennis]|nr:hypothetical protein J6590_017183 [Homalodisca vitripennis]
MTQSQEGSTDKLQDKTIKPSILCPARRPSVELGRGAEPRRFIFNQFHIPGRRVPLGLHPALSKDLRTPGISQNKSFWYQRKE